MKKLITMAVSLILMAVLAVSASASGQISTEEINFDVDRCVDIAKDFIETYYDSVYLGSVFVNPIDIQDENLEIIINSKLANDRAPQSLLPCKSWEIKVSLSETNEDGDLIIVKLIVDTFYSTDGSEMLFNNCSGEYFAFTKSGNDYILINWLTSDLKGFDLSVYGYEELFMNMKDYISLVSTTTDYSEFAQTAVEHSGKNIKFLSNLDSQQKQKAKDLAEKNVSIKIPQWSYGLYNVNIGIEDIDDLGLEFNRSDMVEWALDNYLAQTPVSASSTVPYRNMYFPEDGSYDCTNFISHALIAGEAVPYYTGDIMTGWWCTSSKHSASWSYVDNFYNFVTSNAEGHGMGPFVIEYPNFYPGNAFSVADLIQRRNNLDNTDTTWNHSMIITGYENISGWSDPVPIVTSRTGTPDSEHHGTSRNFINYYNSNYSYRLLKTIGYRPD